MKRQNVKERIIEAASHLFYFEGYNQTGINKILKEANVSKDSMYRHFRSKEDVAVAYLKGLYSEWMGDLLNYVKSKKTGEEKIIASFDYVHAWLSKVQYRGCGWQNIYTDLPEDQNKIKDQVLLHKNLLREWVQNLLIDDKKHSIEESKELGDEIIILLEGALITTQIQSHLWPIETAKRATIKLLS
tara:strand:+ start:28197 stop:28757 length:561 start_codon:yes stop_codon:yes gene_type:complete